MAEKRPLGHSMGVDKWFASEDGKHYRGESTDLDPVFRHVRYLDDKVNGAPKSGNKQGMEYIGSIPAPVLVDWLRKNNIRPDQFARNEDGAKAKFLAWFKQRENHRLLARDAIRRHA